jgi:Uma2 family endonuclease
MNPKPTAIAVRIASFSASYFTCQEAFAPMTIATTKRLTFEEFLSYDDGTDIGYELVQGELKPMGLGTGKHGKITQFLDDRLNDEIRRTAQPWTSQRFTVGIQSPRGNRWDTCRIPDITVLLIAQWDAMENRESVIRAHEPPL